MQPEIKKLIKELAERHGMPVDQVEKLIRSQFILVRGAMREGIKNKPETFKNVRLIKLGIFGVKPWRIEKVKENQDEWNRRRE